MPLRLLPAALLLLVTTFASAADTGPEPAAPSDAEVERAIDAAGGLPALPDAPPANLVAPAVEAPAEAAATTAPAAPPPPPLTVELAATDAVGTAPVPPGDVRALRVVIVNRGAAALTGVAVTARTDAAQIQPTDAASHWRVDATGAHAEIRSLAAGKDVSLPITLKAANVAAASEAKARLSVEVQAKDVPTATAEFVWAVRDCPGAFHEKLQAVRTGPLADLRRAVQTIRRGDAALPGWLTFAAARPMVRGPVGDPLRLAGAIASRRGGDPEFSRSDMAYTMDRTILELDQYITQRAIPSLCTGVPNLVKSYRDAFGPAQRRLNLARNNLEKVRQAHANGDNGNANGDAGDLVARTRHAAIEAGLLTEDAPADATALAVLARARSAAASGKRATPAGASALADLEIEAWLTEGATNATRVSEAFAATLDGIKSAHDAACTCAW